MYWAQCHVVHWCTKQGRGLSIGESDDTAIYGHDTISILYGMMSYSAKLTGEELSRYLHKTESVGLRKP